MRGKDFYLHTGDRASFDDKRKAFQEQQNLNKEVEVVEAKDFRPLTQISNAPQEPIRK
jgi:hypothetical protein